MYFAYTDKVSLSDIILFLYVSVQPSFNQIYWTGVLIIVVFMILFCAWNVNSMRCPSDRILCNIQII